MYACMLHVCKGGEYEGGRASSIDKWRLAGWVGRGVGGWLMIGMTDRFELEGRSW